MELAENMSKLTWPELEALDEAWHVTFCELIALPDLVPATARPSTPENTEPELQDDTIVYAPEVLRRTGLSPSSLYRMRTDGRFPAAIQSSERRVGWKPGGINDWIEKRQRQRVFRRRPR
jgi:predicted DNA-binding transcriptional regulator AlpA